MGRVWTAKRSGKVATGFNRWFPLPQNHASRKGRGKALVFPKPHPLFRSVVDVAPGRGSFGVAFSGPPGD